MKMRVVKQKGTTVLAWISLAMALTGGTIAVETLIGQCIQFVLGALPWTWIPSVLLAVAIIGLAIDLFIDMIPNQTAIWSALTIPSIAASVDGKLGVTISRWCGELLSSINDSLSEWVTNSATGLAVSCIGGALIMAKRVVKKNRAQGIV